MVPYGLVLAGGGAKGAYQIGAWKALRELGIEFSIVAGASIGAINGALIASDAYEKAISLWDSVTIEKGINITAELPNPNNLFSMKNFSVLLREVIKNGGIDASPTKVLLEEYISEEDVRNSGVDLGIVAFQLSGGMTPLELRLKDIPEGQLLDYILASANVPGVSNIGPDGEKFLDGGFYDNTPVGFLRRNGINRLIVLDISNMKGYAHSLNIYNAEVVYIRPYDTEELGAAFDFSFEMKEKRMTLGYNDAMKAFGRLLGNIYYFTPDEFMGMIEAYTTSTCYELEKLAWSLGVKHDVVYTADEFLRAVKVAFEEKKAAEEQKAESPVIYTQIKKAVSSLKKEGTEDAPEEHKSESPVIYKQIKKAVSSLKKEGTEDAPEEHKSEGPVIYKQIKKAVSSFKKDDTDKDVLAILDSIII